MTMLAKKSKELFISVLKFNIELIKDGYRFHRPGAVESLEDVLEKTQEGLFDDRFVIPFSEEEEGEEPVSDDYSYETYLFDESARWEAMAKDYEKGFKKVISHMKKDEFEQCVDKYISVSSYMWDRHRGYDLAGKIMAVTTC